MLGTRWIESYLKAGNRKTSIRQLAVLALSKNHRIRMRVAENPRTPPGLLMDLAQDPTPDVRLAVATNPSCPLGIILKLVHDEDPTVRHGLAEDPSTRLDALKILADDANPYVSCRARKTMEALGLIERKPNECHHPYFRADVARQRFA